jgi:hypothetical protein
MAFNNPLRRIDDPRRSGSGSGDGVNLSALVMVRLAPDDHAELQRMASSESRSLSAMGRIIFREALAERRAKARRKQSRGA